MLEVSSASQKPSAYTHAWITGGVLLTAGLIDVTVRQTLGSCCSPHWRALTAACMVGVGEVLALREISKKVAGIDYQAMSMGVVAGQAMVFGLLRTTSAIPVAYAGGSIVSAFIAADLFLG